MTRRHSVAIALVGAMALGHPGRPAQAAPTVIRDDLLRDLAITPTLGRGYSLSTNTFQSLCMSGLVKTKPSYNFYYKFEELEADGSKKSDTSVSMAASTTFGIMGLMGGSFSVSSESQVIEGETYHSHHIQVTIQVEVYYASVDESVSKISEPAREILINKDIPGFFDACGSYYVRSLNRRGEFISLFSYKTREVTRDTSFEMAMKAEISSLAFSTSVQRAQSEKFASSASSKQLTITSTALGLGKNESASLIAYDLPTFKAAIKDAFTSMQQEDVGMVTSMEVVPWVENADFQRTVKLYEPKPNPIPGMPPVSPYAQKRILNLNSEFLSEVDRVARSKLNIYYRAKLCRGDIDANYKTQEGELKEQYQKKKVINYKTNDRKVTLKELDEMLNPELIETLFKDYRDFLFGDEKAQAAAAAAAPPPPPPPAPAVPGQPAPPPPPVSTAPVVVSATSCVRELLQKDMAAIPFRDIASCKDMEKKLVSSSIRTFDEVCMPRLVD